MVRRKELLVESSTYKAILEKGIERGIEQGIEQGRAEGVRAMREACAEVLKLRLGELPPDAKVLEHLSDLDQLRQLAKQLAGAADEGAVLAALRAFAR